MQKYADYIKEREIESLWSGQRHVVWQLDRRVNVLSGVNGVGKSTILNKVVKGLAAGGEFPSHMLKGVHLTVSPADAKWILLNPEIFYILCAATCLHKCKPRIYTLVLQIFI